MFKLLVLPKQGPHVSQRPYHIPVWTVMLWSHCFQSSCWSWFVIRIIYTFREIAATPSSCYRCFYLLSLVKMLDAIFVKGGAVKSFVFIYEQRLLSACPFECPMPLLARASSKIAINVLLSRLFPFKISPSGVFKTVIPALFSWCKRDWRQNWGRTLSYHCNQEVLPKHSISVHKCCF